MAIFTWNNWKEGKLPELEAHSRAKLSVLRDYVTNYICILCSNSYGRDVFKITLVDGFAGGGVYDGGQSGSPFVLLEAVAAAETLINANRAKPLSIDCHFYFAEKNAENFACLKAQLENSPHKDKIGKSVFLLKGTFHEHHPRIVELTQERFRRGGSRVIFFLDQCGYTDVDPRLLKSISESLNKKAEFIINFAVSWLTDFVGDRAKLAAMLSNLGLDTELRAEDLIRAKENSGFDWRYLIEAEIGRAYRKIAGSQFFCPFYIAPVDNHRGYWLLHLSPHIRARSAMLGVHWKNANGHRHFGNLGLNMLSFKPEASQSGYLDGFDFTDLTRTTAKGTLKPDFARVIRDTHSDGISFKDFAAHYSNLTIADETLMAEAIQELSAEKEILILGPKGSPKRSDSISQEDMILPCNQLFFPLA